ncbi:unnamed protein product [Closterium sp. NIES-65]|nr:unnamed protein product [Closterium sp. NIES-65]
MDLEVRSDLEGRESRRGDSGVGGFVWNEQALAAESWMDLEVRPYLKAWPYLKVRPALHRLRLLSAANARFFNLSFVCADRRDYPNFYPPLKGSKVKFAQISSDAGYLVRPSYVRSLLLAPGERKDILVDFSSLPSVCRDVITASETPFTNVHLLVACLPPLSLTPPSPLPHPSLPHPFSPDQPQPSST